MRVVSIIALLACFTISAAAAVRGAPVADEFPNRLSMLVGVRSNDVAYDEYTIGIDYARRFGDNYTLNLSTLIGFGSGEFLGSTVDTTTLEIGIGGGYEWRLADGFTPYAAGGLAIFRVDVDVDGFGDDDVGFGPWFALGIGHRSDQLFTSFQLRYSTARVVLGGDDYDAGGLLAGVTIGYLF